MTEATALSHVRGLRSVAGDTLIYGASIAAVPVALILATPILTRALGTSDFGLIDVLSGAVGVTAIAAMLGMDSAITRSYFDVGDNRGGIARAGALLVVAVSGVAALVGVGVWALVVGHDLDAAALAFLTVPLANALAMARLALLLPRRRTRYLGHGRGDGGRRGRCSRRRSPRGRRCGLLRRPVYRHRGWSRADARGRTPESGAFAPSTSPARVVSCATASRSCPPRQPCGRCSRSTAPWWRVFAATKRPACTASAPRSRHR